MTTLIVVLIIIGVSSIMNTLVITKLVYRIEILESKINDFS